MNQSSKNNQHTVLDWILFIISMAGILVGVIGAHIMLKYYPDEYTRALGIYGAIILPYGIFYYFYLEHQDAKRKDNKN